MLRRDFLRTAGLTAGASIAPFLRFLPTEAAGREDTLVVIVGLWVQGFRSVRAHRAMVESTTLQTARPRAPRRWASRSAARVSAVSPDWLMATARSPSRTIGRL